MKNCKSIEILDVFRNKIKKIEVVKELPLLYSLNVSYNPIEDIEQLKELKIEEIEQAGVGVQEEQKEEIKNPSIDEKPNLSDENNKKDELKPNLVDTQNKDESKVSGNSNSSIGGSVYIPSPAVNIPIVSVPPVIATTQPSADIVKKERTQTLSENDSLDKKEEQELNNNKRNRSSKEVKQKYKKEVEKQIPSKTKHIVIDRKKRKITYLPVKTKKGYKIVYITKAKNIFINQKTGKIVAKQVGKAKVKVCIYENKKLIDTNSIVVIVK